MTFDILKQKIDYYKDLKSLDEEKRISFLKSKGWQVCCMEKMGEVVSVRWGTQEVNFSTYSLFSKYLDEAEKAANDVFNSLKNQK